MGGGASFEPILLACSVDCGLWLWFGKVFSPSHGLLSVILPAFFSCVHGLWLVSFSEAKFMVGSSNASFCRDPRHSRLWSFRVTPDLLGRILYAAGRKVLALV